jgi:hypothetical protein
MNRNVLDIVMMAVVAAVFFFVLQTYVLNAKLEIGLQWALVAALGAGYIAWSQQQRR